MKKRSLILIVAATLLASCVDHESLYDSTRVKEEAKANFPVKNIDPTQDWATRGIRTLDVTVNEGAEKYTIKVFTANPLVENTDARLLTEAEVKNGSTSLMFDVSLALEYVYVMCKAGEKDYSVSAAPMVGEKFVASFGTSTGTRAYDLADGIVIDEVLKKSPADFILLKDAMADGLFAGGEASYNLPAGNSLTIKGGTLVANSHIYVSGTLEITGLLEMSGKNASISVLEGGKLIFSNASSTNLSVWNGGVLYNAGTIEGAFTSVATDAKWLNDGNYSGGSFLAQSDVQNNCKLDVKELSILKDGSFNNGGYVKCTTFNLNLDAKLNLSGKSVFDVHEAANLGTGTITGPTAKPYPLFKANSISQIESEEVAVKNTVYTAKDVVGFFATKFKVVKATIGTLPEGECVPPVNVDSDNTEDISLSGCTIGFEDVNQASTTDYDFNDVVLWVSNVDKTGIANIYLVAAGATNRIKVGYTTAGGRTRYLFEGKEVHELVGEAMFNTSGAMVTTGLPVHPLQVAQQTLDGLNFFIEVNGDTNNLIYSKNGKEYIGAVPFALCISEDWAYPAEKKRIDEAYSNFGAWGANKDTNKTWYKEGVDDGSVRPFNSAKFNK